MSAAAAAIADDNDGVDDIDSYRRRIELICICCKLIP